MNPNMLKALLKAFKRELVDTKILEEAYNEVKEAIKKKNEGKKK